MAASATLWGQQGYPPQGYPQQGYPQPQQQNAGEAPPDQPGQAVAHLTVINGDASIRRGDSGDWVAAALNAPVMAGDSISVGPGGSAELQLDYANFVRISGETEIRLSDLESGRNQIQIAKGLITWRVLRDSNSQSEISSPAVAVRPLRLSAVRVEVAPDGMTRIVVRRGDADASTPKGTEHIHEGNMMLVQGSADDPEYQVVYAPSRDAWDTWNDQRDSYLERAQSNRYLSRDIDGGEDLDAYGRWGNDPAYGNVWTPSVPANWAPYQDGQWVWEDYYGWTWVDYQPWGWAPFHYGSWYFRTGLGWSWFPGARSGRYWWHPAMVGFFGFGGGLGMGFGFGSVGWVPLAPFEVFHPWYGRGGFGGRAFGAGIVNNVNIAGVYRNARVANGVTAVPGQDFERGVFRNRFTVNRAELQRASLVRGALPIAPTANNLRFSERAVSGATPRGEMANQRFFSRMPAGNAAAGRTSFARQQASARSAFGDRAANAAGARTAETQNGWRRFGEPASGQPGGIQRSQMQPRTTPGDGGGWERFGSPPSGAGRTGAGRSAPGPNYRGAPAPRYRSAPAPGGNRGGGGSHGGGARGGRR